MEFGNSFTCTATMKRIKQVLRIGDLVDIMGANIMVNVTVESYDNVNVILLDIVRRRLIFIDIFRIIHSWINWLMFDQLNCLKYDKHCEAQGNGANSNIDDRMIMLKAHARCSSE